MCGCDVSVAWYIEDREANFMYGADVEHESTFMVTVRMYKLVCYTLSLSLTPSLSLPLSHSLSLTPSLSHSFSLPPSLSLPLSHSLSLTPSGPQSESPYNMELNGTPEPFSTGTSLLSSLPNIPHSYREANEEEEEEEDESVRAYTMGPVLRVGPS